MAFDIKYLGVYLSTGKGVKQAHKTNLVVQGVEFGFKSQLPLLPRM